MTTFLTGMRGVSFFFRILKHPNNYPGKHQESVPRTIPSYKPLEPKSQFHIVFKATAEYIQEKMLDGKVHNKFNTIRALT